MTNQQDLYKLEAYELLSELEKALMDLEETPEDKDLIGCVFRAMHTIKGSGAMFGFDDIAEFTHNVETIYDQVRNGEMAVTKELIDLSLSARDLIAAMLEENDEEKADIEIHSKQIIDALKALPITKAETKKEVTEVPVPVPEDSLLDEPGRDVTYRIRFKPHEDLFSYGTNPVLLLDEISRLGLCHIIAHTSLVPDLEHLEPESCYIFWDIILTTDRGLNAIKDVFIFVEDSCDISIQVIDEEGQLNENPDYKKLGDILVERGDISAKEINDLLVDRKLIGEILVEAKAVDPNAVESALIEQEHVKQLRKNRRNAIKASSIRVDAEKLDSLVNLVGELVTVQARLSQKAIGTSDSDLLLIAEEVERLTAELRDNTMSVRMLPIGTTFSKFQRLVRDLSNEMGKIVTMSTEGGDTELDKTVIEQLDDPLVHIIRNSIDHGIELPDDRKAQKKPKEGNIHLSAVHSGAHVLIEISDDGAGLDSEAIRSKAISQGLIEPDADLSEKEVFNLIFEPGFSTAQRITDVSGRGVGMDVVKQCIENLRGNINVRSEKGAGTTITLKLPLTLAIIDGFMVKIGDGDFVFPLSAVEECVEMTCEEIDKVKKTNMMNIRGEIMPYQSLRESFGINGRTPDIEKIVVAESGGQRIGFGVDKVIGQHQTVIKNLGSIYKNTNGLSGATILGDGSVALILDVGQLVSDTEYRSEVR